MNASLCIGVISDTHNRLHPRVAELFEGVDEIWHLGDVCDEPILDALTGICPKLVAVRGNNDHCLSELPLNLTLEREGENFHLIHIPPGKPIGAKGEWVLHGHTHIPRNEMIQGVHWFNPGSAGLANKGAPLSVARLSKKGKGPFIFEVIRL